MKKSKAEVSTPIDSKEIATIKAQGTKALSFASTLEVKTKEDYAGALDEGKHIKEISDKVKSRKEEITKPLNDALKSVRALFKPIEENIDEALSTIKSKMTTFYVEQQRIERAEKEKIAAKVESGYIKPETAMQKMSEVTATEKTVETDSASGTVSMLKKYRVIDKAKIPLEFMEPDIVKIGASFRAGKPVDGIEQYEEPNLSIG